MPILEKITEEERELIEDWFYPISQAELLFHNFDDLGKFSKDKFGEVRNYQIPFLSFENFIDYDAYNTLTEKEKFQLRKGVGDVINVGARKFGKTCITLRLDITLSGINDNGFPTALYSIDDKRLRGVVDYVYKAFKYHPIAKNWDFICKVRPQINFESKKTGWKLQGVNLTLKGKNPGEQWYQIHATKIWGEEVSFETKSVAEKRIEAESELGAVVRLAGMTNFTKHSPIGELFKEWNKKSKAVNLPQYVNRFSWDADEKAEKIKRYGGEFTVNYKMFVEGEIVDDAISELDMERIEKCYRRKKEIKRFEINKKRYSNFKNYIIIERPKVAERIFIADDCGKSQSELIVHAEINGKYKYLYNITLYNLIKDEELEVLKYIINKLKANVVALDCGDARGRILADDLEKIYSKDNIVRYAGGSKIEVDIETDENGNTKFDKNGKIIYRQEYMKNWAIERLKSLLYEEKFIIPYDNKLDVQFTLLSSHTNGDRKVYKVLQEDDHLFDAWQVLVIAIWLKIDFNKTPDMGEELSIGGFSW